MDALHPMAVHLPIALVLIWPVVDAIGLLTDRRDVSAVAVGLLLLSVVAALFATVTGQAAYEVAIEAGFEPALLDRHVAKAELVPWALLVVALVRLPGARRFGRPAKVVAIVLGLVLIGVLFTVGTSGGELVFEHRVGVRQLER